jgi:hypothetical protein
VIKNSKKVIFSGTVIKSKFGPAKNNKNLTVQIHVPFTIQIIAYTVRERERERERERAIMH